MHVHDGSGKFRCSQPWQKLSKHNLHFLFSKERAQA
ncbi:uncharacterized protein METZ01_LOCUS268548, partial [marine metagenome]